MFETTQNTYRHVLLQVVLHDYMYDNLSILRLHSYSKPSAWGSCGRTKSKLVFYFIVTVLPIMFSSSRR